MTHLLNSLILFRGRDSIETASRYLFYKPTCTTDLENMNKNTGNLKAGVCNRSFIPVPFVRCTESRERENEGRGATRNDESEGEGSDDSVPSNSEVNLVALSQGKFNGQPWVNSYGATVTNEEIASSPVSGYCGSFFLS